MFGPRWINDKSGFPCLLDVSYSQLDVYYSQQFGPFQPSGSTVQVIVDIVAEPKKQFLTGMILEMEYGTGVGL